MILLLFVISKIVHVFSQSCPIESARNIPSGSITVNSNTGWVIGGWGYASPYNSKNFGDQKHNWGTGNFGFGNFGNNNQGNSNYGNGNLGNNNLGDNNVGNENCGNNNVGTQNIGSWNVGNGNNGTYNLGQGNLGTGNTGNSNNGQINVGALNNGQDNVGISNLGNSNFGISNDGNDNVGWQNSGDDNVGGSNSGDGNVGVSNIGTFNLGFLNSGQNNTGGWNYGQGNVGYLAGVQNVQITENGNGTVYWKNVQINQLDSNTAINNTGWVNINNTNVGIGQSGSRNIGFSNVGLNNIGYDISGTEDTGYNLTGTGLIGFDINNPDGSDFTPVTIQGITDELVLLNSSVIGFIQDSVIGAYPQVFTQAILQAQANQNINAQGCSSFTPVPIINSFSISVRCTGSVKITDFYCSGDSFNVYKDGKLWLSSPTVSVNNDALCVNPQKDPEEAFYDPGYAHVIGWVPSGSYKITVVPTVTRWGGGAVAIKVDDFCDRTNLGNYIRF